MPLSGHSSFSPSFGSWQPLIRSLSVWICLFGRFNADGITQHGAFCVWFLLLPVVFPGFIHVVAHVIISFVFMAQLYSIARVAHLLCIYLSFNGHLDRFHVSDTVNSAAVNLCLQAFVCLFFSVPSPPTASYGNSILTFLRNRETIFHSGQTA